MATLTANSTVTLAAPAGAAYTTAEINAGLNAAAGITGVTAGAAEPLNLSTFSLTVSNVGDLDLTGIISGTGAVTKSGAGVLTLSGVNTYTGATTVSAGTLSVSADTGLGEAPSTVTADHLVLGGGALRFTGSTDIELSGNRGINITADSIIDILVNDGARGGSVTYSGIMTGTSDLTLNNSVPTDKGVLYLPSLILNGVNTATGDLVVAEGNNVELINTTDVDGNPVIATWAGPVDLSGDLKGNGSVLGAVTSTGGRLSPGTTVGSGMTIASLSADVNTQFYFGFDNAGADTLTVTGTATLTTSATDGPEIVVVPYVATADGATRILIDAATLAVTTASSVTNTTFAGYADGNEDVTDGTFAKTLGFNANTGTGHYEMVIPA